MVYKCVPFIIKKKLSIKKLKEKDSLTKKKKKTGRHRKATDVAKHGSCKFPWNGNGENTQKTHIHASNFENKI